MVDVLYKKGRTQPGLWKDPSADHTLAVVREAVDTGTDLMELK